MVLNRYKPVGWQNESHRHYLAAKGIKTKYDSNKYFASMTPQMREQLAAERLVSERKAPRLSPIERLSRDIERDSKKYGASSPEVKAEVAEEEKIVGEKSSKPWLHVTIEPDTHKDDVWKVKVPSLKDIQDSAAGKKVDELFGKGKEFIHEKKQDYRIPSLVKRRDELDAELEGSLKKDLDDAWKIEDPSLRAVKLRQVTKDAEDAQKEYQKVTSELSELTKEVRSDKYVNTLEGMRKSQLDRLNAAEDAAKARQKQADVDAERQWTAMNNKRIADIAAEKEANRLNDIEHDKAVADQLQSIGRGLH